MSNTPAKSELASLARDIKRDLNTMETACSEWAVAAINLCKHLWAAREKFSDHREFHQWLEDNGLGEDVLNKNDRAAAIKMGEHMKEARPVLETTQRRSLQMIARDCTFPNARKGGTGGGKGGGTNRRAPRKDDITSAQRQAAARAYLDDNKTYKQIEKELGVPTQITKQAVHEERGRREPQIDPATLSMSAREKLDAAIRQQKREQETEFETRVLSEIQKRLKETVLPSWEEKIAHAEQVLKARRYGVFSRDEYRMILSCLHPDSRGSVSDKKLKDAFEAFKAKERVLIDNEVPNLKVVQS